MQGRSRRSGHGLTTFSATRLSDMLCTSSFFFSFLAFSALTLLVGRQEGHPSCKKTEWWGAGVVVCLEPGADLHVAQLMPLPLTVSCFSKIQLGFTFLVPAHPGSPGKGPLNGCVCVCVRARACVCVCVISTLSVWLRGTFTSCMVISSALPSRTRQPSQTTKMLHT